MIGRWFWYPMRWKLIKHNRRTEDSISIKEILFVILLLILMSAAGTDYAKAAGETELAKQTQNPVSDLISLPFQNNTNFDIGPDGPWNRGQTHYCPTTHNHVKKKGLNPLSLLKWVCE